MDKQGKLEYMFLKRVTVTVIVEDEWDKSTIENLYREFQFFLAKSNINELSILRKGEVMLGQYCNITDYSYKTCQNMIYTIINTNELAIPIQIAIIGAILKLYLENNNNKEE